MGINRENFPLKVIVAITYVIMVAMNALANILPINGVNTGQVSDFYENLFAPAGITFAIWGVIYLLLLFYVIYQFGFFQNGSDPYREQMLRTVGIYFSLSSILNTMWILAWHYDYIGISLILIVGVLLTLIFINQHTKRSDLFFKDKFFVRLPFSIYFGWITVATIANVTAFLVSIGWKGFGISDEVWTVAVLIVGLLIAVTTIIRNRDFFYGLVIIWAYAGIYIKHTSVFNSQYSLVIYTLMGSGIVLALAELYVLFSKNPELDY